MNDDSKEIILEEYKQLRTEIRHLLDRRSQNIKFAFTITLGVIGFGVNYENSYLFFAGAILICSLWFDEIRRLKAIHRSGTFIEVVIEPELPELKWETYSGKHKIQTSSSILERLLSNFEYPFMFLLNCFTGLFVILKETKLDFLYLLLFAICVSGVLTYLVIQSLKVVSNGRDEEVKFWKNIKYNNENSNSDISI